jgi:hypothetical protein
MVPFKEIVVYGGVVSSRGSLSDEIEKLLIPANMRMIPNATLFLQIFSFVFFLPECSLPFI